MLRIKNKFLNLLKVPQDINECLLKHNEVYVYSSNVKNYKQYNFKLSWGQNRY